jgi:tetratricopeptide (TPR) repeat protein
MQQLYFILLFQLTVCGQLMAQHSFRKQHETFMRRHADAAPDVLLSLLQTEEKLIGKGPASSTNKARLALDLGIYYYMIDDYPKSIDFFGKADRCRCLPTGRDEIVLYTYLGVSYRNGQSDYEKAHTWLDKAIAAAQKAKNADLLTSAMIKKADTYYYQGQYARGARLLESFLPAKEKVLTLERRISVHARLGEGYDHLGNYAKCYANYTAAIDLAGKTHNDKLLADQYHNFAHFFLSRERYAEAKGLVLQVIRLLRSEPESEWELNNSYTALAQIYSSLQQPDSALYYASLAHDYSLRTGNEESLMVSHGTLGHVYFDQHAYAKALDHLLKAAAYEERFVGVNNLANLYHNIGLVYLRMRNFRQAIVYLDKSNRQSYREGDIYTLYLNYDDLAKAQHGLGNLEQVVAMKDSAFLYYDSLNNIEKHKELLRLETRYQTRLKGQENKVLKLEVKRQNDLAEKEKKARRDTLMISLVLIVLLSGVVYILWIGNRLKKSKVAEANAKIRSQELEEELLMQRLDSLAEEIERKNHLIRSLENGASTMAEENLINKVTLENDWLAFMSEFDKVHRGYLSDLKHRFPTLTTNNLRIASLVKLGFSNKEIAGIMSITENGVKKAKQRLKERTASIL